MLWEGALMKIILFCLLLMQPAWAAEKAPAHCQPEACDQTKPVCKVDQEMVNLAEGKACCPRWVCNHKRKSRGRNCGEVCVATQPFCGDNQTLVNKASDGACCPNWVCERKTVSDALGK
jgi:hypothetical protein